MDAATLRVVHARLKSETECMICRDVIVNAVCSKVPLPPLPEAGPSPGLHPRCPGARAFPLPLLPLPFLSPLPSLLPPPSPCRSSASFPGRSLPGLRWPPLPSRGGAVLSRYRRGPLGASLADHPPRPARPSGPGPPSSSRQECLHRFCKHCIEACLRKTNLECPVCRKHLRSKRSFCPDPAFDALLATLYGDVAAFNAREEAFLGAIPLESYRDSAEGARQAQILLAQQEQKKKRRSRLPGLPSTKAPPPAKVGAAVATGAGKAGRGGGGKRLGRESDSAFRAAGLACAGVEEKYRAKRGRLQAEYHAAMQQFRRALAGEAERARAVEVRLEGEGLRSLPGGGAGAISLVAAPDALVAEGARGALDLQEAERWEFVWPGAGGEGFRGGLVRGGVTAYQLWRAGGTHDVRLRFQARAPP